jgi:cytoskeletal protein CcmA (bactofilin family)
MFSKADKSPRTSPMTDTSRSSAGRGNIPSIISADLRITGDLECSGDIQIDGVVNGDIQSRNIVIGEGAAVAGSLQAETVQVFGKLVGQIRADTVTLERTAHVEGDILHKMLAIAQGAFLEGACRRIDSTPPVAAAIVIPAATSTAVPSEAAPAVASEATDKSEPAVSDAENSEDDDGNVKRLQAAG